MFPQEFVQAVNDWQRGGNVRQKERRGRRLAELAAQVDGRFRTCEFVCLRQLALEKGPLWNLLADRCMAEAISSWTLSMDVARKFKGGVPPEGWQGVIFALHPASDQVVLNIAKLYQDVEFQAALAKLAPDIDGYADGAGRYGGSQLEVVLKVDSLDRATALAMGGYSSDRDTLIKMMLHRDPTERDIAWFENARRVAGVELGPYWLEGAGWERVLARMEPQIERLREVKRLQDVAKS